MQLVDYTVEVQVEEEDDFGPIPTADDIREAVENGLTARGFDVIVFVERAQ